MGLISWFKDKYYNSQYNKAVSLYHNGQNEEAIQILQKIRDIHLSAPIQLLEIYHSHIKIGNTDFIRKVTGLFQKYPNLRDSCINFCKKVGEQNKKIAIDYSLALYKVGLDEMFNIFINNARDYVLQSKSPISIGTLTIDPDLINKLAETLYTDLKNKYEAKEYEDAKILSESIKNYYKSNDEFLKLYYYIQWECFAKQTITNSNIAELDELLKNIQKSMPVEYISDIEGKINQLSKLSCSSKDYVAALLLSYRIREKSADAQDIYKCSAYFILKFKKETDSALIDKPSLYKMFGEEMTFINEVERFVSLDSEFEEKYLSAVVIQLQKYAKDNNSTEALPLMVRACNVKFKPSFFESTINKGTEKFSETIVTNIISDYSKILTPQASLSSFVDNLLGLSDKRFVLSTLENMLKAGYDIKKQYTDYNISCLNRKGLKPQLEILTHALRWVENETLLNAKYKACEAYIKTEPLGDDFIVSQCNDLVDKHPGAQILLTDIFIHIASEKKLSIEERDKAIRSALSFKSTHSTLFHLNEYEKQLPIIDKTANQIARQWFSQKSLERAVSLLHYLRDNNLEWYETYVDIYTSISYNSEKDEMTTLKSIADEGLDIGSVSLKKLWERLLSLIKSVYKSDTEKHKLVVYTEMLDSLSACKTFDGKDTLIDVVVDIINQIHFNLGVAFEKTKDYENAVLEYKLITDSFGQKVSSIGRMMICELKEGKCLPKDEVEEMKRVLFSLLSENIRKELAFRLCLFFAQKGDIEDVCSINNQYLNDSEMEAFCCDQIIKKQEEELKELNEQISLLSQGQLSANDAILLGQNLSGKLKNISSIVTLSKQEEDNLKESIRLYAIEQFYYEGNYINCQAGLKVQDSTYLSDPINLRNIAVMCLYAAENSQLTDSVYKEFLALWATAIYQQEIFIKSLDYTSWDDPYTFTLNNALGVLQDNSNLPENVGYADETEENVVSIREVQKALISRMDVALDAYPEYQKFFNEQIKAMEMLSHVRLDQPCVIVAPYLLRLSSQYKQAITNSLEIEERAHYDNWEEVLHIGNLYDITIGNFEKYQIACQHLEYAKDSLLSQKNRMVAFDNSRIETIKDFNNLFSSLVASVTSALNMSIAQKLNYKEVLKDFYPLCRSLQDNSLSFAFSNYINQEAVSALNGENISLCECAYDLFKVYKIFTGNPRLNTNLKNVVSLLVNDYLTNNNINSLNALDNILNSTRDFDQSVTLVLSGDANTPEEWVVLALILPNENTFMGLSNMIAGKSDVLRTQFERTKAKLREAKINVQLSEIVKGVNNGTLSKCNALNQVYNLYKSNKDNKNICSNLANLIPMCVMEYIAGNKWGAQSVRKVLDSLKKDKSQTFMRNNSVIRDTYNSFWNQLSIENRSALLYGTNLTAQGIALKEAFNYLEALS